MPGRSDEAIDFTSVGTVGYWRGGAKLICTFCCIPTTASASEWSKVGEELLRHTKKAREAADSTLEGC
ncbi:hypothetical protein CBOM_07552 [Ceraceosorus bombacis]|uniref:Uncharacterized protein n=1 Tax=Ceraceosorus bombacis TaxID=401625 RepID=A0A0P1BEY7_9BASI|nr:hypothetical protein CBOM_07552 [Ceraceosorus bombacis]